MRHKIEKAGAAKVRKDKKLAKKDPTWRTRLKKDPGIPNLFPYKDRLLAEIEEAKQQKKEETLRKREEAKALRRASSAAANGELPDAEDEDDIEVDEDELVDEEMDDDQPSNSANPMEALLASARARAAEHAAANPDYDDEDSDDGLIEPASRPDPSARAFSHLFPEVLAQADVILYVLDARDPQSTRSIPTERQVAAHDGGSKRLILILNKIDLVPPQVLARWTSYLRRYQLVLPLRASAPASGAKVFEHKDLTQKNTAKKLLHHLKAYAEKQQLKRAISVGVVGYPNVGKSSVINALVSQLGRKSAPAQTGAEAGVTTALRNVKLDSKLTLIDSPGVVFPAAELKQTLESKDGLNPPKDGDAHARLVLLNAVPPKAIEDPVPAVQLLLRRISSLPDGLDTLRAYYGLPPLMSREGDISTDFLVQVARKRGRLGKGGVPNFHAAGMSVLGDWRDGRIGAWVEPPKLEVIMDKDDAGDVSMEGGESGAQQQHGDRKEIVTEWAKEFDLGDLWGPGAGGDAA